jgi:hypothetical protein
VVVLLFYLLWGGCSLQDHVEGIGHDTVVVDEGNAEHWPMGFAEIAFEPLLQFDGSLFEVGGG